MWNYNQLLKLSEIKCYCEYCKSLVMKIKSYSGISITNKKRYIISICFSKVILCEQQNNIAVYYGLLHGLWSSH